jgi:hypothetical protein
MALAILRATLDRPLSYLALAHNPQAGVLPCMESAFQSPHVLITFFAQFPRQTGA